MSKKTDKHLTYEESIKRLEEITEILEKGEMPLDESLALFEEGVALVRASTELLDKAEQKVFTLVQNEDGNHEAVEQGGDV